MRRRHRVVVVGLGRHLRIVSSRVRVHVVLLGIHGAAHLWLLVLILVVRLLVMVRRVLLRRRPPAPGAAIVRVSMRSGVVMARNRSSSSRHGLSSRQMRTVHRAGGLRSEAVVDHRFTYGCCREAVYRRTPLLKSYSSDSLPTSLLEAGWRLKVCRLARRQEVFVVCARTRDVSVSQ